MHGGGRADSRSPASLVVNLVKVWWVSTGARVLTPDSKGDASDTRLE